MVAEPSAASWLIDKSALVRLDRSHEADAWRRRIDRGLVRISTLTLLQLGYSARSVDDLREGFRAPPISSMPVEYMTPAIEDRALQVLTALAERGQHRAPSVLDILIAAVAEKSGLRLLHLDKDFELIAEVTRQPIERLEAPV
jgi:predicted nucleic acid-binding protein